MFIEDGRYLYLLLVVPLYLVLEVRSFRRNDRWLRRFSGKAFDRRAHLRKSICMALAFSAAVLSLTDPYLLRQQRQLRRSGIRITIGIDVSKSMLAEDAGKPDADTDGSDIRSRLDRARAFAARILERLAGEQVGLFIFARNGVELVPLTQDYGYGRYVLGHLNNTDMAAPGSDLAEAIRFGETMLTSSDGSGAGTILLLSDGEDERMMGESLQDAVRRAKKKHIPVHAVGIGTPSPALIPLRTGGGGRILAYARDADGAFLKTRLVEETLRMISEETGGAYLHVSENGGADRILRLVRKRAETTDASWEKTVRRKDLSPVFMLLSAVFFGLGFLVRR